MVLLNKDEGEEEYAFDVPADSHTRGAEAARAAGERLARIVESDSSYLNASVAGGSKSIGLEALSENNSGRSKSIRLGASSENSSVSSHKFGAGGAVSEASSISSNGECGDKSDREKKNGKGRLREKGATDEAFRFLVVDDVISVRKVIAVLLKKHKQEIVEAGDGVDAVKAYKKSVADGTPFDCVFMDFVMPHMDGPTATK